MAALEFKGTKNLNVLNNTFKNIDNAISDDGGENVTISGNVVIAPSAPAGYWSKAQKLSIVLAVLASLSTIVGFWLTGNMSKLLSIFNLSSME